MNRFINYNQLTDVQIFEYQKSIQAAFPKLILESPTSKKYWPRLESYFPEFQLFFVSPNSEIIGFMNAIPFHFKKTLDELPDDGWDWMLEKGISDYEQKQTPNYLGGLQIIINKENQGMGYSKSIINQAKQTFKAAGLKNLVIPIRPTKKSDYPKMAMDEYIHFKTNNKLHDPWIRTHLKGGAQIIKVCHNSMNVQGDISFWESILNQKISSSGTYLPVGALNSINIDIEQNKGEYREPNIWIKYA